MAVLAWPRVSPNPVTQCVILAVFVIGSTCRGENPWTENEQPKMFVDYVNGPLKAEVSTFRGNQTNVDNFKLMERDDDFLLIGATNSVYFLKAKDLSEIKDMRITWESDATDFELCTVKGKSRSECQNHIRILAKLDKRRLLVCGTHAYRPRCRHYTFKDGRYIFEKEFNGKGLSPYDPYHNSSFVVADGELYTATVSDFSGLDPLIYKEPLRTEQYDSKHLNSPDFVSSLANGDYVYFFFREQAVEYINCGKSVYSRVARVCKSDQGGPNKYKNSWTTFLKSRLNCSLPGEYPFYFDHLQSMSGIISGSYGGQASQLVYGVFTTPGNSIYGNAICAFRLRDLLDTFEGAFKEQETSNSNWLPVPKIKEPSPRPGRCSRDSQNLPESTLSFVKGHSIMDEAVPAFFGTRPLFVEANLLHPSKFRELAVDPQVETPSGQSYDVLFVGTTNGRILKIVNTADPSDHAASRPTLVEEIAAFPSHVTIEKLSVVDAKLLVLTRHSVVAFPLDRCAAARSCRACVALQDPYCAWDTRRDRCASLHKHRGDDLSAAEFIQDVVKGHHDHCSDDFVLDASVVRDTSRSVASDAASSSIMSSPESSEGLSIIEPAILETVHYSAEELSMAVATSCVCALIVGFIAGFLLARKCTCSREENPYHVPYLNQSGYNEEIYAKVDDMTYYPITNMLVTSSGGSGSLLPSSSNATSAASSAGMTSKTLHHSTRPVTDFQGFGTVHRSQKIYL